MPSRPLHASRRARSLFRWAYLRLLPRQERTVTFAEMAARIEAIRRRTRGALLARSQGREVGCIMTSQSVFFPRGGWVADHADWHPRIQGGMTIDVASGDGRRILTECLLRAARMRSEAEPLEDELRRYGAPQIVQPRLGQATFRVAVTSAYGACAVTGDAQSLPAGAVGVRQPARALNVHPARRSGSPSCRVV